jgi:beta-carotene 3-hydroxylase
MTVMAFALLFLAALIGMEAFAWAVHRYLMHGPLWSLHRSHHEPQAGWFERNDLFAVLFALPAVLLINRGLNGIPWMLPLGLGATAYGILYTLFHDGVVHRRFPLPVNPRWAGLRRLVQAHRLHHAVRARDGAVSFGFLWAPSPRRLKARLQRGGRPVPTEPEA